MLRLKIRKGEPFKVGNTVCMITDGNFVVFEGPERVRRMDHIAEELPTRGWSKKGGTWHYNGVQEDSRPVQ